MTVNRKIPNQTCVFSNRKRRGCVIPNTTNSIVVIKITKEWIKGKKIMIRKVKMHVLRDIRLHRNGVIFLVMQKHSEF